MTKNQSHRKGFTVVVTLVAILLLGAAFLLVKMGESYEFEKYFLTPPQSIQVDSDIPCMAPGAASQLLARMEKDPLFAFSQFPTFPGALFPQTISLQYSIDSAQAKPQGYILQLSEGNVHLTGGDSAGLFYGHLSFMQLLHYASNERVPLPTLTIQDWPDFQRRGYMLDISRDKVPTMKSLFALVDVLAQLKINEFQLYIEHTFAYKDHPEVWENASPMTPEEIRQLDTYCKARFIDLVPNQNSLGHMENWLSIPSYRHLAECPDSCTTKWGTQKPTTLNPTHPEVIPFVGKLYDQLLPAFSSKYFQVGGDEAVDFCLGNSQGICEEKGKAQVYVDYLIQLDSLAKQHGKSCQVWADILVKHPEVIPQLPKDMTVMVWGYDAWNTFEADLDKFKDTGLSVYVCPGTSTWRSLIGQNARAFENLERAAVAGKRDKIKGYLITTWGDYGHFQPHSVTYPSLLLGSAYAWHRTSNSVDWLPFQLSHYVFKDKSGHLVTGLLKLGDAYLKADIPQGNANIFHQMLRRYKWTLEGNSQTKVMRHVGLQSAKAEIKDALAILQKANPTADDASILFEEIQQAAGLALHSIELGMARLDAEGGEVKNIPEPKRKALSDELGNLISNHRRVWGMRNRIGGLDKSSSKLEELHTCYGPFP